MIYQDAKKAFKERKKIKAHGILYEHINAIIFRRHENIEVVQLELQDINTQNSVTTVKMENAEVEDET